MVTDTTYTFPDHFRREGQLAIVIPTYNNAITLGQVLTDVLVYSCPGIVVNVGSTDDTAVVLN